MVSDDSRPVAPRSIDDRSKASIVRVHPDDKIPDSRYVLPTDIEGIDRPRIQLVRFVVALTRQLCSGIIESVHPYVHHSMTVESSTRSVAGGSSFTGDIDSARRKSCA